MTSTLDNFPEGEVLAIQDDDERVDAITRKVMAIACCSVELNDTFHLLLSGNHALEKVYSMLMLDPDLRGLPWHRTHAWKLHGDVEDNSIYEMITFHSGMPEEHVHQDDILEVLGKDDSFEIDCCILDLSDIPEFPETVAKRCKSIVVVAHNRDELTETKSIPTRSIVYWFTSTIDLLEESQ